MKKKRKKYIIDITMKHVKPLQLSYLLGSHFRNERSKSEKSIGMHFVQLSLY